MYSFCMFYRRNKAFIIVRFGAICVVLTFITLLPAIIVFFIMFLNEVLFLFQLQR